MLCFDILTWRCGSLLLYVIYGVKCEIHSLRIRLIQWKRCNSNKSIGIHKAYLHPMQWHVILIPQARTSWGADDTIRATHKQTSKAINTNGAFCTMIPTQNCMRCMIISLRYRHISSLRVTAGCPCNSQRW